MGIKKILKNNRFIRYFYSKLVEYKRFHTKVNMENHGYGKYSLYIIGNGTTNYVNIGHRTLLNNPMIRINGCNNRLIIGDECIIGPNCSFWLEGNNVNISIGNRTTFSRDVQLCAQEDNMIIEVGDDCMFSNNIIIRTSDSHPIYDVNGTRINLPGNVSIGNHVWIAPNSKVFKGVRVGNGSIIGSNTVVTKSVGENVLAVGLPAKVVKSEVTWTHEELF